MKRYVPHILSITFLPGVAAAAEEQVVFETVISSSRVEQAADDAVVATEIISRREIESAGARDLAELLEVRGGLEIERNQFGAGIRLQGLDPAHVLILVDGQRLTGRDGGVLDLSRIPLESVSRVEIVRGPASALYGSDAMGGVVNVITRGAGRPLELAGEVRAGANGLVHLEGTGATHGSAGSFRLTGAHRRRDAFQLDTGDIATTGSSIEQWNLAANGSLDLAEGVRVDATASWLSQDRGGVDRGAGNAVFDRTGRTSVFAGSLRPVFSLGEASHLRLSFGVSVQEDQLLQDQRGSSALDRVEKANELLLQGGIQGDTRLGDHLIVVGTEILYEEMEADRLGAGGIDRLRLSLYGQDEWSVLENLTVAPGVRLDGEREGDLRASPRIGLMYRPWEALSLRASYGWAWRAPSFQELAILFENPAVGYVVTGNPELRPETSRGMTVGAQWRIHRRLGLDVSVYHNDIDDLITVATEIDPARGKQFIYQNVERARTAGVDGQLSVDPLPWLKTSVGYGFLDARNRDTGMKLEGRATHRVNGTVSLRSREMNNELTARASFVGSRPFIARGGEEWVDVDPYFLLTVHIRQGVTDSIDLIAGGDNLLGAGEVDFLPMAPRTFYAGMAVRY